MVNTPADWYSGQRVTGGGLEAEIHDQFADLIAPWTDYTPVWASTGTAVSLGNGTLTGRYKLVGKKCTAIFEQVMGSTTTFGSGTYSWTMPFTAASPVGASANWSYLGSARGHGAAWYAGTVGVLKGGNTARIYSHAAATEWSPTEPTTWTAVNTRYLSGQVTFEIA